MRYLTAQPKLCHECTDTSNDVPPSVRAVISAPVPPPDDLRVAEPMRGHDRSMVVEEVEEDVGDRPGADDVLARSQRVVVLATGEERIVKPVA